MGGLDCGQKWFVHDAPWVGRRSARGRTALTRRPSLLTYYFTEQSGFAGLNSGGPKFSCSFADLCGVKRGEPTDPERVVRSPEGLQKAESWISQAAAEGELEALVYLRSRGHVWPSLNRLKSIESTAMAMHALAESKPTDWRPAAKKGRDWLLSEQASDGAWREEYSDPAYLTVLVLDAISLADADDKSVTTFTRIQGAARPDAPLSDVAAGPERWRGSRGPDADDQRHSTIAKIVALQGNGWRRSADAKQAICIALDNAKELVPDQWTRWKPNGARSWQRALEYHPDRVVKVLQNSLNMQKRYSSKLS